jgi:hypothetical protein
MIQKKMLLGLGFVASFLLGGIGGAAVVFFRTVPPMAEMLTLATLSNAGNEAYVRYRYGTYPVAKAALLRYADQAKTSRGSSGMIGPETTAFDVGLTYARLAVAAERSANQQEAATYMNLAKEEFGKQRRSYDEPQIRAAVERLDKAWDESLVGLRNEAR